MGMVAAIVGGLGAAGSIGGALIQSNAATTASKQQQQTAQNALGLQQQLFGTAQQNLQPFINTGANTIGALQSLLTPGPSQTATLEQLPGFQFQSQYGTMAAINQLASMGLGGSKGPLATAISNYNQGLAGTSFNNLVAQLQGVFNTGASSAGALASAAGAAGQTMGQTLGTLGTAQAAGTLGSANALSGGLTGATSSITSPLLLSSLLSNLQQQNLYGSGPQGAINAGTQPGVSNGGFNFLDAQAG